MLRFLLIAFLSSRIQATTRTDPLWHSFTPLPSTFTQSLMYSTLQTLQSVGSVIKFSGSNSSADYSGQTWYDPCFDRALTNGATYVMFWIVGDNAYCTVYLNNKVTGTSTTAPFAQKYLKRVETQKVRCE
ncbi:unnamed protein product [Caenorhabditis sp. 36 PRJEB53466]|nr:unnamed protein product [Caenorhabditis sp. 36 PRJEB53466]